MPRGYFITLEGAEGVGKSTNLKYIKECLTRQKLTFIETREPGGTPLAEEFRQILLEHHDEKIHPQTELLLMFAARAQHIQEVILPALAQGVSVISDRFTDASFAYQGYGRGLSLEHIEQLQNMVQGTLQPDLTILLDAPVSVGQSRVNNRAGGRDRIEQEKIEFFERVRQGYLSLAKANPERFAVIDAELALPKVQAQIKLALSALLSAGVSA